jgi:hypothetical protein
LAIVLSPQHFKKFLNEAVRTRFNPFVCYKQFDNEEVTPFDITQVEGYWSQEILRYLTIPTSNYLANSQHPFSGSRGEGNDNDASRMRPKKMLRRSKDNDGVCTGSKELLTARYINMQSFHTSRVDGKTGYAFLSTAEVMQNPPQSLNVSSEVEVLSQDSGIRGCWFRASIIKKHKDKVKVRYQDISDAANEAQKLEVCILCLCLAVCNIFAFHIEKEGIGRIHTLVVMTF